MGSFNLKLQLDLQFVWLHKKFDDFSERMEKFSHQHYCDVIIVLLLNCVFLCYTEIVLPFRGQELLVYTID